MLQNKQILLHLQYDVKSVDALFAYPKMLNISTRPERSYKNSTKELSHIVILTDPLNAVNKILHKISFHKPILIPKQVFVLFCFSVSENQKIYDINMVEKHIKWLPAVRGIEQK